MWRARRWRICPSHKSHVQQTNQAGEAGHATAGRRQNRRQRVVPPPGRLAFGGVARRPTVRPRPTTRHEVLPRWKRWRLKASDVARVLESSRCCRRKAVLRPAYAVRPVPCYISLKCSFARGGRQSMYAARRESARYERVAVARWWCYGRRLA